MAHAPNIGTTNVPLVLATKLSAKVNEEWADGVGPMLDKVTPTTRDLLRYWFSIAFTDLRDINFHEGQRQAILNTIYLHEVLKPKTVKDNYMMVEPELAGYIDHTYLDQLKNKHPKYCLKLATGTGKTWIMHALLIWQYLNAREEEEQNGRFTKNFLLVAPGLIVYERLLDAYAGKENEKGERDFTRSDFFKFQELLLPPSYRDAVFNFVQSATLKKDEISRKATGEGIIAITNWHLLAGIEEEEGDDPTDYPEQSIRSLRPIAPGTSGGNSLGVLDRKYLVGNELRYLIDLKNLVVFNDEAHHIHEFKKAGEIEEVEWQKSLDQIAEAKKEKFIQIDFSATPYNVTGSGRNRTKHFFPHIIVDFDLTKAIKQGLVKIISLDRRKELGAAELDFKAQREGNEVVGLSEGQRIMLRAGLTKLHILEKDFVAHSDKKNPKLLIVLEDIQVAHFVEKFLKSEGLETEEVLTIHSNKKNEVGKEEWEHLKQILFNIDQHKSPKVIISVLMLREGFDVNNICVIVPLRSSEAPILLEQILGRGLRLMWREPEYREAKEENRMALLKSRNREPNNYLDMLFIVEHPAYAQFYEDLEEMKDLIVDQIEQLKQGKSLGDLIIVPLKEGYGEYDLFIPHIIRDQEEYLDFKKVDLSDLAPFPTPLPELLAIVSKGGDTFFSEEMTKKTRFGEYKVTADLFSAQSYNEMLAKMVKNVTTMLVPEGRRAENFKEYPRLQIDQAFLAAIIDSYIRNTLFNEVFDPLEGDNWRVLRLTEAKVVDHIIRNVTSKMHVLQQTTVTEDAIVQKQYFSQTGPLTMRENYSIEVSKAIYEKLKFPSNKGGFERAFIEFCDSDVLVKAFMKIDEHIHKFARVNYIRDDGILAPYYPDFIVKLNGNIYIVETKAESQLKNPNVLQKRKAAVDFCDTINKLKIEDRNGCIWHYCLLGEDDFYGYSERGANIKEILDLAMKSKAQLMGKLSDFVGIKEY